MDANLQQQKIQVADEWQKLFDSYAGKDLAAWVNNQWTAAMQEFLLCKTDRDGAVLQGKCKAYAELMDLFRLRISEGEKAKERLANITT